jgi:hypothetical protein
LSVGGVSELSLRLTGQLMINPSIKIVFEMATVHANSILAQELRVLSGLQR